MSASTMPIPDRRPAKVRSSPDPHLPSRDAEGRRIYGEFPGDLPPEDEPDPASAAVGRIRGAPEARLWTSVVLDALKNLRLAGRWISETYPELREDLLLERLKMKPNQFREKQLSLELQRNKMAEQLDSCIWFFFSTESFLEFICSALGYDIEDIRRHVRSMARDLRIQIGEPPQTLMT
jgi:hypothetical protein